MWIEIWYVLYDLSLVGEVLSIGWFDIGILIERNWWLCLWCINYLLYLVVDGLLCGLWLWNEL